MATDAEAYQAHSFLCPSVCSLMFISNQCVLIHQVVDVITASQKRNAMIFNALFQLHTAVTTLLPNIPDGAMQYIEDALKQLAR